MDEHGRIELNRTMTGWLRGLAAVLTSVALTCGMVAASGGIAQAAPPDSHRMTTWNMRYGPDKWDRAFDFAQIGDVVALQEVPQRLPRELGTSRGSAIAGTDIRHWQWERNGAVRHLYILRTDSRDLGMITTWQPERVLQIDSVYRPALAVTNRADAILFASMHAETGGGNDGGALLRRVEAEAADQRLTNWVALGDFNREPGNETNQLGGLADLPEGHHVYNSGQATHESGNEYDYAVGNVETDLWAAEVHNNRAHTTTSDHWPVVFGGLRAAAEAEHPQLPNNNSANAGQKRIGKWRISVDHGKVGHTELRKRTDAEAELENSEQPDTGVGQMSD